MLVITAVHLSRPLILRAVIDTAIPAKNIDYAVKMALLFVAFLIIGLIAAYIRIKITVATGANIVALIKEKAFKHILTQDLAFFDNNKTGTLITRTEANTFSIKVFVHSIHRPPFFNRFTYDCHYHIFIYPKHYIGNCNLLL